MMSGRTIRLQLLGCSLRVYRRDRIRFRRGLSRTASGELLAGRQSHLLALFGALDPAIFGKSERSENQEGRDWSANSKRIDGNHGSYPSKTSVPIRLNPNPIRKENAIAKRMVSAGALEATPSMRAAAGVSTPTVMMPVPTLLHHVASYFRCSLRTSFTS